MLRLYYVTYGQQGGGKTYSYLGSDRFRTNQTVVVPVTHKDKYGKIGKTYNTMAKIMGTYAAAGGVAEKETERLSQPPFRGVKFIHGTDVFEKRADGSSLLPSASKYPSKASWARESKIRHDEEDEKARARKRLLGMEV